MSEIERELARLEALNTRLGPITGMAALVAEVRLLREALLELDGEDSLPRIETMNRLLRPDRKLGEP